MFHMKKNKFGQIRTKFGQNLWQLTFKCSTKSGEIMQISCEFRANLTEFSHLVHRGCRVLRKTRPISTRTSPHAMGRCDGARPKDPFHLVADRTRRRRLQDLQQVVSRELAAPYTVKYLPDTGQIVLIAETRVTQTVQSEPSMQERLIMAVWRIRSWQVSRTEAREHGIQCGMGESVRHASEASFTGVQGVHCLYGRDTAIHGEACYLPDRISYLYKCRPPPPSDIMKPGHQGLHCLHIAVDATSRHEAVYVHCMLDGTASPNQLSTWWQGVPNASNQKWAITRQSGSKSRASWRVPRDRGTKRQPVHRRVHWLHKPCRLRGPQCFAAT